MIGGIVGGNSPDKSRPSNYHQRHPPSDATPTPKTHPFFFGADWNSLRHIEPPFVPHLQSMADTSYFPTEEFGNVAEQMEQVEGISLEVPELHIQAFRRTVEMTTAAAFFPLRPRLLLVKQILHDDLDYLLILRPPSPATQP
ncbi:hypothetical protein B0H14DRAFT_3777603 [Mycena olivaceomarginata]|nr:hypothetical protein B0H14DRAFT_3777603 [Mycena olivaceomarginata]